MNELKKLSSNFENLIPKNLQDQVKIAIQELTKDKLTTFVDYDQGFVKSLQSNIKIMYFKYKIHYTIPNVFSLQNKIKNKN